MAYVNGFERDVFVSYAHADNLPLGDEADGWITKFHRSLVNAVKRLIRDEGLEVWRDVKLRGNDEFNEVLEDGFRRSALMISVLTPSYAESEWCRKELSGFSAAALSRLGLKVGEKNRIFKVMPWHLPHERHPEELGGALGYKFYALDPLTDEEESFRRTNEQDSDQRYWRALSNLARDIVELLRAMKKIAEGEARPVTTATDDAPTVYLAEVTDDLLDLREQVRRSLE